MKKWTYVLTTDLRSAIDTGIPAEVFDSLVDCYWELNTHGIIDDDDYEAYTSDFELYAEPSWFDGEEDAEFTADYELSQFYTLCDNTGVWIPI